MLEMGKFFARFFCAFRHVFPVNNELIPLLRAFSAVFNPAYTYV